MTAVFSTVVPIPNFLDQGSKILTYSVSEHPVLTSVLTVVDQLTTHHLTDTPTDMPTSHLNFMSCQTNLYNNL